MTDPKLTQNRDKQNQTPTPGPELRPYAEVQSDVRRADDAMTRAAAMDRDSDETMRLSEAERAGLERVESDEGVFIRTGLVGVMAALKRKNSAVDLRGKSILEVARLCRDNGVILTPSQTMALQKAMETGANVNWEILRDDFVDNTANPLKKAWGWAKENPRGTIALLLAGAFAVYFGPKVIKWLTKKGWGKTKSKLKEALTPSAGQILGALGIVGVGAYLGRDALKAFLYSKFGIQLGNREAQEALDKIKRGEMPEDLKARIDRAKAAGKAGAAAAATDAAGEAENAAEDLAQDAAQEAREQVQERTEDAKEDALEWLGLSGYVANPEELETHRLFSAFIRETTGGALEVPAYLFAQVGNVPYEAFLEKDSDILEQLYGVTKKLSEKEFRTLGESLQKLYSQTRVKDLVLFFRGMLKEEGDADDFPEFKGKTITQVMQMIMKDRDRYLDPDALEEVKERKARQAELLERLKDPEILTSDEKRDELLALLAEMGAILMVDVVGDTVIKVIDKSGDVIELTHELSFGVADKIADRLRASDNAALQAAGVYLDATKYTIAIGAATGMTLGFVKSFAQRPSITMAAWGAMKGVAKGAAKGALLPVNAAKLALWDMPFNQVGPRMLFWDVLDRNALHALDDLRINRFIGSLIGSEILPERLLSGAADVPIDDVLMRRLVNYSNYYSKQYERYRDLAIKAPIAQSRLYSRYAARYKEAEARVGAIFESVGWENNRFNPSKLFNKIKDADLPAEMTDELFALFKSDKRFALIFLNQEHPLSQLIRGAAPEQVRTFMETLHKNPTLFAQLRQRPHLAFDHHVRAAFLSGDFEAFAKITQERMKVWEKFSPRELAAFRLDNKDAVPAFVSRYTELADRIAEHKAAVKTAAGGNKKALKAALKTYQTVADLMTAINGPHATFIAQHADELADLFKNTPEARRGLEVLAGIPPRYLKAALDSSEMDVLKNLARALASGNEAAVAAWMQTVRNSKEFGKIGRLLSGRPELPPTREAAALENRRWYEGFAGHRGAKFRVGDLVDLAQLEDTEAVKKALIARGMTEAAADEAAPVIARAIDTMDIQEVLKKTADAHGEAIKFSPAVGRLAKIARAGGAAFSVAGFGFSAWQSGSAFYEAATTKNSDRRTIALAKGALYGVSTLVDGAEVFLLGKSLATGAAAAGAGAVGAAAFALAPITYMGEGALDSMHERTKTVEEWRQTDRRQLIHEWISTHGLGAGDAYRLFTSAREIGLEKGATREKIAEAILRSEAGLSPEAPVDPHRMHYLKTMCDFEPPAHYRAALDLLRESRQYADIMTQREAELLKRRENPSHIFKLNTGLDVLDAGFDHPGKKEIETLLRSFRQHALTQIPEALTNQFNYFSTRHLIELYCDGASALYGAEMAVAAPDALFLSQLEAYLTHRRRVNLPVEVAEWRLKHPDAGEDAKGLEKITAFRQNPAQALREDIVQHTPIPAVYAVSDLAEFFGYTGYPNEEELKQFFDENHKGAFGIYWDGSGWYVNEAGYERDDAMGPALTDATVRSMIARLRVNEGDVIETRHDAVVDIVETGQFNSQVAQMVAILERGLSKPLQKPDALKPANAENPPDAVAQAA